MKNICIVGYGAVGPFHAQALKKTQNACFYGVCDIDSQKIRNCQKQYDVKGYNNFHEMLKDGDIDGIHICTPHYLHSEMIISGLHAGKTIVVEKPVAMTKEQFELLLHTEGIENVGLVFQNRLNPCAQKIKDMIQKQSLGKLICARAIVTWNRSKEYYLNDAWRGKWSTEGGGVLINQSIHTLDLMTYLTEDIQSVKANMTNYSLHDTIEVEDTVSAHFKYVNGATGIFFATNAYLSHKTPDIEFVFENGRVRYTDDTLWVDDAVVCRDLTATGERSYYGLGHIELIRNFYDHNQRFTVFDAQNTMNTLYAMYESAKTGQETWI